MATFGKIKPFNPAVDEWPIYKEKLEFYFHANGIADNSKKRSILLTQCGDSTFKLLRSLVPNGKLDADDVTYKSLIDMLKDHYGPKESVIIHRFNFNTKPEESITAYIAALRELALNCEYSSTDLLEEMLWDRLVCGVNHQGLQQKLLAETNLTFKSALKLAQSVEAVKDALTLGSTQSVAVTPVHYATGRKITCYRCGEPHLATQCKHQSVLCSYCKKRGHFAHVCKSKQRDQRTKSSPSDSYSRKKKPPKHTPIWRELPQ